MGRFIEEVAKINVNENHKMKISEERDNVRNALYKRINREFRDCDDYDKTYNHLMSMGFKNKICYQEHDFGMHVTMDFVETTYFRQLKKIYKMYKECEKAENIENEKEELSTLYIVFNNKEEMMLLKTYERHAQNNTPYDIEKDGDKTIKHYKILDRSGKPYDFKLYYTKIDGKDVINILTTTQTLRKDGLLDGIKTEGLSPFNPLNILLAIPIIIFLLYIGFHALIGILLVLFVLLIVLCG